MNIKNALTDKALDIVGKTSALNLPKALLIIPDGNGRWAKQMGLQTSEGHKKGGEAFARIVNNFAKTGIEVIGVWGFSEDNWKREKEEIDNIMSVIKTVLEENLEGLMKNQVKFVYLGKKERIEKEYKNLFDSLEQAVEKTKDNNKKTLALFIDYGERFVLEEFAKERGKDKESSTYELLSKISKGLPLFDMVLRTSGELRMSGFGPLASLSEFVTVSKNLPDLTDEDVIMALSEYSKRQRRFGGR